MNKIIGIGNALTDVLVNLPSDDILAKFDLERGSMSLVGSGLQMKISEATAAMPRTLSLGGSTGNTIRALAKLGVGTGFIGKVGQDTTGIFLEVALENLGVKPSIYKGEKDSGRCLSLISPDGERTMATHLGAALEMTAEEITPRIYDGFDCLNAAG